MIDDLASFVLITIMVSMLIRQAHHLGHATALVARGVRFHAELGWHLHLIVTALSVAAVAVFA